MTNEREEARRKAEVMLAFADGAEIQYSVKGSCEWMHAEDVFWNWCGCDYRVKPKPREAWVVFDSGDAWVAYKDEESARRAASRVEARKYCRMREVVE